MTTFDAGDRHPSLIRPSSPSLNHPGHQQSIANHLLHALQSIHRSQPTLISWTSTFQSTYSTPQPTPSNTPSAPSQHHRQIGFHRRASVAIIIRFAPPPGSPPSSPASSPATPPDLYPPPRPQSPPDLSSQLNKFFDQPWVQASQPELFLIKRATRQNDRWSTHLAFPGGRMEVDDEDELFCAMRETWEEVGIDLAEQDFISIGRLDDREITTSLGKRLLMVLSPFLFLCTRADGGPPPSLEPGEVAAAYWVPLATFSNRASQCGEVTIDLSARLAPTRGPLVKLLLRSLVGQMRFRSILLPDTPVVIAPGHPWPRPTAQLHLWGLTLGMTLDLLSFFDPDALETPCLAPHSARSLDRINAPPPVIALAAPSMTSIFPRFTHPDINALIWLLGRRYRQIIAQWAASTRQHPHPTPDSRISWTGRAMNEFYKSVRKALIVGMILRGLLVVGGVGWVGWWVVWKRWLGGRRMKKILSRS